MAVYLVIFISALHLEGQRVADLRNRAGIMRSLIGGIMSEKYVNVVRVVKCYIHACSIFLFSLVYVFYFRVKFSMYFHSVFHIFLFLHIRFLVAQCGMKCGMQIRDLKQWHF